MLDWLIPIGVFFPLMAIYLGGLRVQPAGGNGLRQVLGLVFTLVVYLLAWRLLRGALMGIGPVLGGILIPTIIAVLAFPIEARIGYLMVGIPLKKTAEGAH